MALRTTALSALLATLVVVSVSPIAAQEIESKDLLSPFAQSADTAKQATDPELEAAERALLEGLATNGSSQKEGAQPPAAPAAKKDDTQVRFVSFDKKPAVDAFDGALPDPRLETKPLPQPPTTERLGEAAAVAPEATTEIVPSKPIIQEPARVVAPNPNAAMKRELEASQRRVSELERQLEEVRGQLTMAETELSRLSSIAEARSRANLGLASTQDSPKAMVRTTQPTLPKESQAEPMPSSADLEIVTVAVDKADLRLGPGKTHSPLMSVARGARLAVEVRQGEWLRVFAPNGQRAWIYAGSVTFGIRSGTRPNSSAVKVRGYSSSLEDDAFKRVQSITSGY